MKHLLRAVFLAAFSLALMHTSRLRAQTTLVAGDIAFTGYNASVGGNNFSFVILRNISGGTSINFTDIGWNPITSSLSSVGTDGVFTWTSSSVLAQFTEVTITVNSSGTSITSVSTGSASAPTGGTGTGTGFILSGSGDQVLAFVGSQSSPTFIAGIHMNSQTAIIGTSGYSSLSGWDDIKSTGLTYSANVSAIPPGLVNGTNAVMVVTGASAPYTELDFAEYNCTGQSGASVAAVAAAINDRANWSTSNTTGYTLPSGCSFSVAAATSITSQPVASSICVGSNATFTVAASNATGYQWQENSGSGFANITTGGVYSGTTGTTLTLTNPPVSMNGFQYRVIVAGTPSVTSNSVTLTVTAPGTWLGGSSTAWSNTANWTCGTLPTSSTNVVIPSGTTYSPLVDITTAAANNLTIASGATLAFTGTTNALAINGAVSSAGTFNTANGKVVFSGSSQTVPALTYQDLQVTGGGSKTAAGAITVNGTLTLTNGHIVLGGNNLTIGSSGSISGGNINSFIVTNGAGGLVQSNIGTSGRTGNIVFQIGSNAGSYTRLVINNTGTADNFTARVINNVYSSYDAGGMPTSAAVATKVVGKTWYVTEAAAGGSNVTLTVEWNGTDELSSFDHNNAFLAHYTAGNWNSGPRATVNGLDPYSISRTGITTFSPFGVGSSGSPLPLQLLTFAGQSTDAGTRLTWSTANEKNLSGFEIERSEDARSFLPVGFAAASGSGEYTYADMNIPAAAKLYYRLKMLDADGRFTYSNTVVIEPGQRSGAAAVSVWPNPVPGGSKLYVTVTSRTVTGNLRMMITDVTGKCVFQTTKNASELYQPFPIDLHNLPAGAYVLTVHGEHTAQHISVLRY